VNQDSHILWRHFLSFQLENPNAGPLGWSTALAAGTAAIRRCGGADVGMRTMLDALVPAVTVLCNGNHCY